VAPRVSVALPCFNAGATLPAALGSLLDQTLDDFEIVAVDDGSTDRTFDVLRAFAARDARLRPIRLPHQGVALAMNAAVAACRAPFIARMDADDLCPPGRLAAQASLLAAAPGLDLVTGRVRFGGDAAACAGYALHVDWLNSLATAEAIGMNRFVESPLANPSVMFRRAAFERFGGARPNTGPLPFPEDYEMWLRWLGAGARVGKTTEEVLVWNDPPGRLSRTAAAYGPQAFARCKAGYLWDWLQANNPRHPEVLAWGAGRESRKRLVPLLALGLRVAGYVDIDRRKIGQVVHGVRVLPREAVPPHSPAVSVASATPAPFVLVNVGSRGAREDILQWLHARGYAPGVGCMAMG